VKLLAILFSFYILLLPAVPCRDINECNTDKQTAIMQPGNHNQHQHEDEGCSPFCSCACCGQSFAPIFQLNKAIVVKPVVKKQSFTYKNDFISSNFSGNIWQPPRLS